MYLIIMQQSTVHTNRKFVDNKTKHYHKVLTSSSVRLIFAYVQINLLNKVETIKEMGSLKGMVQV